MWKGTGSTNKRNLSCYRPRVRPVCFFRWFDRGGGSIAAAVTLDPFANERKKMADGVTRSSSRLCSRVENICTMEALSKILLLFYLSSFSFFSPSSRDVHLRVPLSEQQSLATISTYFLIIRSSTCSFCLCYLYPASSRNSSVFYSFSTFRSSHFSGSVFLLCSRTRYASNWFCPPWPCSDFWFFSFSPYVTI